MNAYLSRILSFLYIPIKYTLLWIRKYKVASLLLSLLRASSGRRASCMHVCKQWVTWYSTEVGREDERDSPRLEFTGGISACAQRVCIAALVHGRRLPYRPRQSHCSYRGDYITLQKFSKRTAHLDVLHNKMVVIKNKQNKCAWIEPHINTLHNISVLFWLN